ncbi:MAG: sulfite exporter TauE/SafE family protein [Deltaproteobacteria bacterium]|nr:sulfite exporter TauE/SafE family protein [Deltaproteobacteria bacterium]
MDFANGLASYIGSSWPLSLAAAFLGGLASSLTPCVYPLIPITAAYVTSRTLTGAASRWRAFTLSVLYVTGLALTYAGLGMIAALTGSFFGVVNTHPVTYLVIGVLLTFMALAMLEAINLPFPRFLTAARNDSGKEGKRWLGALAMGFASGFVAGPCTVPVFAALLGYAAAQGNPVFGFLLLFVFSFGLGTLLILVGTFSSALGKIPKSGAWMARMKMLMGLMMLAVADYFIYRAGAAG